MSTLPGEKGAPPSQPRRSRIVVNVEELSRQPPRSGGRGGGARSSRAARGVRRVLAFIAIVVAAVFVLGGAGLYFWWRTTKETPAYALALVVDAAERGDRQAFDAVVDVDSVTRGMVPQVIEKATGRGSTLSLPAPARRFIAANAAVLLPGARDQIRDAVMQELKSASSQSGADNYPFFVKALVLPRLTETIRQGAERDAPATVIFSAGGHPIEIQMQRDNRQPAPGWKIVNVKSDELAGRIAGNFVRSLPPASR